MGNRTFILLHPKVPTPPTPGATCLNTHQTATFQPLKLGNIKKLWKKLLELETWRNYQNIRTTHPILANGTFILLYSKVRHPPTHQHPHTHTHIHTPRYHSNSHNLVSGTGKYQRSLKEIHRIWKKKKKNIRKTLPIPTNGSSIVPYKKVLKGQ